MDEYEVTRAARAVEMYVRDDVSNWYVRRNRRRFWKGDRDADKTAAYQTLRTVVMEILTMIAPIAPFIAEDLFQRLRTESDPLSVHLVTLQTGNITHIDADLERRMHTAQRIVFLARSLREKSKIKTRQPLQRILVPVNSPQERRDIQAVQDVICEELNIKTIEYVSDDAGIVRRSTKANFKVMGKKYGKNMKDAANVIRTFTNDDVRTLQRGGGINIAVNNEQYEVTLDDVEVLSEDIEGWLVASESTLTVALDTELNPELIAEGTAREFVNRVQTLRKSSGLEVTDRIIISVYAPNIQQPLEQMSEYICAETLATELRFTDVSNGETTDINDEPVIIAVKKV